MASDDDGSGDTLRSTLAPRLATPDSAGRRAMDDLQKLTPPKLSQALLLEEAIGFGGMGIVHVATQTSVGRKVAVKMLRPEQRTPASAMHLLREAWITGRLEHPSVVPIYDVSLDENGQPVIVLRRIEGLEWGALLHEPEELRRRFKVHDQLEWHLRTLMQVSNAVHFAHQRGILHRDLKPENVMVGELGEVYVLDWGIAVSLGDDGSGRLPLASNAKEVAGTPHYMAPEMWIGDPKKLTPRTDVYLLGAILYEILVGAPPHQGRTVAEVSAHAGDPPQFPKNLPAGLQEICRRAISAEPGERPESALAFRRQLESYLERRADELLAAEAERTLSALTAELSLPKPRRDALYNLFGACRFGFEQVLARSPEDARAHEGLSRAVKFLVEHELASDDPKAAAALLASLGAPDPELAARVAGAARDHAARTEQLQKLQAIGREHDSSVGQRTRAFISLVLGLLWTLLPLSTWQIPSLHVWTYSRLFIGSVIVLFLVGALGVWARESMSKTAVNRGVLGAALFAPVAQLLLVVGNYWLKVPIITANVQFLLVWSVIATVAGLALERRLLWAAAGYAASWLIAARWPETHKPLMALSNFILLVVMLVIWRPTQIRRRG